MFSRPTLEIIELISNFFHETRCRTIDIASISQVQTLGIVSLGDKDALLGGHLPVIPQ